LTAINVRIKLGALLERVVSKTTADSDLWEVMSNFHLSSTDEMERKKGIVELQKAQRTSRQIPSWEKDLISRNRVVFLTIKYSQGMKK
jgi:hypothetical protein